MNVDECIRFERNSRQPKKEKAKVIPFPTSVAFKLELDLRGEVEKLLGLMLQAGLVKLTKKGRKFYLNAKHKRLNPEAP